MFGRWLEDFFFFATFPAHSVSHSASKQHPIASLTQPLMTTHTLTLHPDTEHTHKHSNTRLTCPKWHTNAHRHHCANSTHVGPSCTLTWSCCKQHSACPSLCVHANIDPIHKYLLCDNWSRRKHCWNSWVHKLLHVISSLLCSYVLSSLWLVRPDVKLGSTSRTMLRTGNVADLLR